MLLGLHGCHFFSRTFFLQQSVKGKKKWTKQKLQPVIEWNQVTDEIYGPVIQVASSQMKNSTKLENKVSKQINVRNEKLTQSVEHTAVVFNDSKIEDTVEYEEIPEPQVITKDNSSGESFSLKLDNQGKRTDIVREDEALKTAQHIDTEQHDALASDLDTRTFLSTILSFPPFTIVWDVADGRLSRTDAAKNLTDVDGAVKALGFPSVSVILKATMPPESKFFLERWENAMIEELGIEGFERFKTELFANGTNLHICIQKYLEGEKEIDVKKPNQGHWKSLQPIFRDIFDVVCTEKPVKHSALRYKGILDCVANYRGKTCVIDWKTSKKPKPDIRQCFDNPIQLAAYLGAYNSHASLKAEIDSCVLVIGYEDGTQATVHEISRADCLRYWKQWQRRLHSYWVESLGKHLSSADA